MRKTRPLAERFWEKADRRGPHCWNWTASKTRSGYGKITVDGKTVVASRLSWELSSGQKLSAEVMVCHRCDNPACVNPGHLFLGDATMNMRDMVSKGRHGAFSRPGWNSGEKNGRARLNISDAAEIRSRHSTAGTKRLAADYGVSTSLIRQIMQGKIWGGSHALQ